MIVSMTGFARLEFEFRGEMYFGEIKSLNSKGCEISMKSTQLIRNIEIAAKQLVQSKLSRGKIEMAIFPIQKNDPNKLKIDFSAFEPKYRELEGFAKKLGADTSNLFYFLLNSYSDYQNEQTIEKEEEIILLEKVSILSDMLLEYRKSEGATIQTDLINWIAEIEKRALQINELAPNRYNEKKERLYRNLQELNTSSILFEPNRLEQEMLIYIEKMDISEELSRLNHHIVLFKNVINSKEMSGKKLGFVCQEIGREINTVGSKSFDHVLQHIVVEMKDYLERIKEQLGNVV